MPKLLWLLVTMIPGIMVIYIALSFDWDAPEQTYIPETPRATPVQFVETPTPLSFVPITPRKAPTIIWVTVACRQEGILFYNPYCPKYFPPGGR